jgi:hypothetical protein
MGRDEVAVAVAKARGQRRCKGDVKLSGKILELPDCFDLKLRGITCTAHRPSFAAKAESSWKNEAGVLELPASAASTL